MSVLIDRILVNYVPLRSAPERERVCGSYAADIVQIQITNTQYKTPAATITAGVFKEDKNRIKPGL